MIEEATGSFGNRLLSLRPEKLVAEATSPGMMIPEGASDA
jgi:hypothetical protein